MAKTNTKTKATTNQLIPVADFVKGWRDIAEGKIKTIYAYAGWGEPCNDKNKQKLLKWPRNQKADIKPVILAADSDTFMMDCFCGIKSYLDGFCGDSSEDYGGATYAKPCSDDQMMDEFMADCSNVSSDMSNIVPGEFIAFKDYSHCGIYVGVINGQRMVGESTYNTSYNGRSGVQLICMDRAERKDKWGYHGKMKYVDYSKVNPSPAPTPSIKAELKGCIVDMMATLSKMNNIVDKM